jgi:ubiquinol-cytochrome c reductase cytochrome c1 subunit
MMNVFSPLRSGAVRALLGACVVALGLATLPCARAQEAALDHWPTERAGDRAALQRGARLFVNYCLNCHSARQMRWNRLNDIGIDDAQIKSELIFGDQKVGDVMTVAMNPVDAKVWFGKVPPDLSVIIRARNTTEHKGTDYVYTLLRSFYRDRSTLTGWNNVVYPNIAMPNILWQRQGPRAATITRSEMEPVAAADGKSAPTMQPVRMTSVFDADGYVRSEKAPADKAGDEELVSFAPADPKAAAAFDGDVADLVAYLNWMSEPNALSRYRIGVWVMGFLVIFVLVARWLNKVYWRDIK